MPVPTNNVSKVRHVVLPRPLGEVARRAGEGNYPLTAYYGFCAAALMPFVPFNANIAVLTNIFIFSIIVMSKYVAAYV